MGAEIAQGQSVIDNRYTEAQKPASWTLQCRLATRNSQSSVPIYSNCATPAPLYALPASSVASTLAQNPALPPASQPGYLAPLFHDFALFKQCDMHLLMGGAGVEECYPPTYAKPTSHYWEHKSRLKERYSHGEALVLSCWGDRFGGVSPSRQEQPSTYAQCVNGEWFTGVSGTAFSDMSGIVCADCVQAVAAGYGKFDRIDKQELYFFNSMKLQITVDLKDKRPPSSRYPLGEIIPAPSCLVREESNDVTLKPVAKHCDQVFVQETSREPDTKVRAKVSPNSIFEPHF